MRTAIFLTVLAFLLMFATMTVVVVVNHGFTILTFASVVVLVLLGVGIFGALLGARPRD